ncbi:MAG: hypothetical protein WCO02_10175 [Bacteroidota bacterium]
MKKVINFLSLLLVISAFISCEYATIVPDVPSPNVPVYYKTQIQPFFNDKCVSCHKSGGPKPDLSAANSYQSLMTNNLVVAGNADNSILYQKISTGSMSGFSDPTNNGLVKNWINQGALDN